MDIADFKFWHWMLIGLLLGAGAGYWHTVWGPDIDRGVTKTIYQREFETGLLTTYQLDHKPRVRDIVIHPTVEGKMWVTGWITMPDRRQSWRRNAGSTTQPIYVELEKFRYPADVPYKPQNFTNALQMGDSSTVLNYVEQLAAKYKDVPVSYKFAWWETPKVVMAIWTAGGFIAIGLVWPVLVRLLVGAGFARTKKEAVYDLDQFKGEKPKAGTAGLAPDGKQLDDLNAAMEAKLAGFVEDDEDAQTKAENEAAEAKIRALPSAPLEPVATGQEDKDSVEYKGEFYPVVKPGSHHDPKP